MIQLASAQLIRDNRQNKLWNDVCKEILIYAELKRLWGKGHIRFMIEPGHLLGGDLSSNIIDSTGAKKHLVIMGQHAVMSPVQGYRTEEAFFGFGIKNAFCGIDKFGSD